MASELQTSKLNLPTTNGSQPFDKYDQEAIQAVQTMRNFRDAAAYWEKEAQRLAQDLTVANDRLADMEARMAKVQWQRDRYFRAINVTFTLAQSVEDSVFRLKEEAEQAARHMPNEPPMTANESSLKTPNEPSPLKSPDDVTMEIEKIAKSFAPREEKKGLK